MPRRAMEYRRIIVPRKDNFISPSARLALMLRSAIADATENISRTKLRNKDVCLDLSLGFDLSTRMALLYGDIISRVFIWGSGEIREI